MDPVIELDHRYGAQNYTPYPIVFTKGEGVYLWDTDGKKYIDMMSAYSAVSFGHCHPTLVAAMCEQAKRLTLVSRAFYNDKMPLFLQKACDVFQFDGAVPMNSGAEAVETAIKAARKWAYEIKNVEEDQAEIIVCSGNFHGRTTTIISFSSEPLYKKNFGPLTPGFRMIPYGDSEALQKAITKNTAAFLVEAIQGEGGIVVPPQGYLKECAKVCSKHNVLLLIDEIQTGFGRTGKLLACHHEEVKPDGIMLGKALGGGLLPVSLFLANRAVMDVFTSGTHGSTFGGNALSSAVGICSLQLLTEGKLVENALDLGAYFLAELKKIKSSYIKDVRGKGLLIGVEVDAQKIQAKKLCQQLMVGGVVTKETHETVIRFAPPLIITKEQIDSALKVIKAIFV